MLKDPAQRARLVIPMTPSSMGDDTLAAVSGAGQRAHFHLKTPFSIATGRLSVRAARHEVVSEAADACSGDGSILVAMVLMEA